MIIESRGVKAKNDYSILEMANIKAMNIYFQKFSVGSLADFEITTWEWPGISSLCRDWCILT